MKLEIKTETDATTALSIAQICVRETDYSACLKFYSQCFQDTKSLLACIDKRYEKK